MTFEELDRDAKTLVLCSSYNVINLFRNLQKKSLTCRENSILDIRFSTEGTCKNSIIILYYLEVVCYYLAISTYYFTTVIYYIGR
jgi:hypothetical protein